MGRTDKQYAYNMLNMRNPIDTAFSFLAGGEFFCDSSYFTERDGEKNILVIATLDGRGYLKYNGTETVLESGSLIVVNCEKYHLYKTYGDSEWHFMYMHFASETGIDIEKFINNNSIFIGSNIGFNEGYHIIKTASQKFTPGIDIVISMHIHKIMSDLASQKIFTGSSISKDHVEMVDKILMYLDIHYHENITAETFEKITNMSKYYFIKIFKEIMNITPHKYLILMRVSKSKFLLQNKQFSIEEIAQQTGFTDINNYIWVCT